MKKVLIVCHSLAIGGIEKSLVALLHQLTNYDVTLLLLKVEGPFLAEVPTNIKIVKIRLTSDGENIQTYGKRRFLLHAALHLKLYTVCRWLAIWTWCRIKAGSIASEFEAFKYYVNPSSLPKETFDVAMAYSSHRGTQVITRHFILAHRFCVWLHCEPTQQIEKEKQCVQYWKHFDLWASAGTDHVTLQFKKLFPSYANRIHTFPLFINHAECLRLSAIGKGFSRSDFGELILFTVGRLSPQKGYDRAINVARRLKNNGYRFKWYVAGGGAWEHTLRSMIRRAKLEETFILIGAQTNPYPYFKTCDIYIQPSRDEGFCITLAEAKLFNRPIVTTNFPGALEQIKDGATGYIVPFEEKALEQRIAQLIISKNKRNSFCQALKDEARGPNPKAERLFAFLDGTYPL